MRKPLAKEPQLMARYSEEVLRTELWISKADNLLSAATLLETRIDDFWDAVRRGETPRGNFGDAYGPYFMLIAFAVENLCKAALIHRRFGELKKAPLRRLPKFLVGHDLLRLIKAMGLSITLAEEDLLVRLSRCAVWLGRYPVPIGFDAVRGSQEFSDGKTRFTAYFVKDDVDDLKRLVIRIRQHVDTLLDTSV
jgi:hypothetical protein